MIHAQRHEMAARLATLMQLCQRFFGERCRPLGGKVVGARAVLTCIIELPLGKSPGTDYIHI
jgi:hypothetical protein